MSADLKPYPAMKDSGVPWLGEVPTYWEVRHLGRIGRFFKGGGGTKEDEREEGIPCVRYGDLYTHHRFFITASRACVAPELAATAYTPIAYGDVLFAGSGETIEEIGKSAVNLIRGPACCGGDVIVFRPSIDAEARFLGYIADCSASVHQKACIGRGFTVMHIYSSDLKYMTVAIPPVPEQVAIVRFLDYADRRIRRYIRAQQQLIALLEEQKQAIIHRAVTRGLDPNVRLKPSGVEWLGDVPEHWTLKRFKFLVQITSGQVDPRRPEYRGKILVAPNHIRSSTGEIVHLETAEDQGADSGKYEVRRGQVIYSKIRPNLRKAAIAPLDCLCSADMYPITVREAELRPAYLLLLLLSPPFTKYAVDCSLRVAMPKVNRDALGECWIWYPNLKEQDSLLEFIKSVGGPSDLAVARVAREVSLLREYRTRLIADVVTGKLDVRAAAARLPDEVEELEPLDEADALIDGEEEPTDALATAP